MDQSPMPNPIISYRQNFLEQCYLVHLQYYAKVSLALVWLIVFAFSPDMNINSKSTRIKLIFLFSYYLMISVSLPFSILKPIINLVSYLLLSISVAFHFFKFFNSVTSCELIRSSKFAGRKSRLVISV